MSGWSLVTYIYLYQHILRNYLRKSCWSKNTYFHDLRNYLRKIGWYQDIYAHNSPHLMTLQDLLLQKFYFFRYYGGRNNGWSYDTNILDLHHPSYLITLSSRTALLV